MAGPEDQPIAVAQVSRTLTEVTAIATALMELMVLSGDEVRAIMNAPEFMPVMDGSGDHR